jgi:hypothetical protein
LAKETSSERTPKTTRPKDLNAIDSEDLDLKTTYTSEENTFRISNPKRFWRGGMDSRQGRKKSMGQECLKVQGLSSTIC